MLVENRGRDSLPLIHKLKYIKKFNYESICIIHSKKSVIEKMVIRSEMLYTIPLAWL